MALSSLRNRRPFCAGHQRPIERSPRIRGRPGQIGIHGTNGLSGAPGIAASHGCIRLSPKAITWLARRIGAAFRSTSPADAA